MFWLAHKFSQKDIQGEINGGNFKRDFNCYDKYRVDDENVEFDHF